MIYRFARWLVGLVGLVPVSEFAADAELLTEAAMVDASPEGRRNVIRMGIEAAKAGLRDEAEVRAAARALYVGETRHWHDLESIRRQVVSKIGDLTPRGHLANE